MTSSPSPGSLSIGALNAAGVERKEKEPFVRNFAFMRSSKHLRPASSTRKAWDRRGRRRYFGEKGERGRVSCASRRWPRPDKNGESPRSSSTSTSRSKGADAAQTGDKEGARSGGTGEEGKREVRGNGGRGKARGRGNGGYLGSEHHHRRRTPYERRKRRTRGESPDAYSQGETGRS